MVERIPCPVCTLYLHPGMNLADHLETHPKDQVIKALVAFATKSATSLSLPLASTSSSSCGSTTGAVIPSTFQKPTEQPTLYHSLRPPLIQKGCTQFPGLSTTDTAGATNSKDLRNGYVSSTQRNVMIVNRQSTMVYRSGDHNESIIGQQLALPPSSLQLFNISTHNQGKFLTPPPAYGTAISQLRSQSNQSIYARHNQSQLESTTTTTYCSSASDQNALDYTTTRKILPKQNSFDTFKQQQPPPSSQQEPQQHIVSAKSCNNYSILSRRSVSPRNNASPRLASSPLPSSVLRFAESPVTAHYVERDNGDFIVQETPRHIVECVEKDDGEFSVIEKVVSSPPSVVQFHDNDESEINQQESENENESNTDDMKCTESIHRDDQNDDKPEEKQILKEKEKQSPKQKKTVSGLTVISNVKLNPNESLDLMENIMASSKNEVEIIWSGIVNPVEEKMEIDNNERNYGKSKDEEWEQQEVKINEKFSELAMQSFDEEKCQTNLLEMKEAKMLPSKPVPIDLATNDKDKNDIQPQSSVITSVIRLASTPTTTSTNSLEVATNKIKEQEEKQLNNKKNDVNITTASSASSRPHFTRETIKRPFRKTPKKLVVKFKNAPKLESEVINDNEPKQGPSNVNKIDKKLDNIDSNLKSETSEIAKIVAKELFSKREKQIERDNSCFASTEDNLFDENKQDKNYEKFNTKEENDENETDVTPIPAIQPMIVYESSLMEEPNLQNNENSFSRNNTLQVDERNVEFPTLLNNCWKNEKLELIDERNQETEKTLKTDVTENMTVSDILLDPVASVNSLPTVYSSNNESQPQKMNESLLTLSLPSSSSSSLSTSAITTLNSFPSISTSNFSKPSTSSSALQQQERTDNIQNSAPLTNYNDYPFSFLYTSGCLDRNRLSPLYPTDLWKNYNGPIFQTQTDFQDIDRERSSYIDLDALKKANSSDAVPYVEALNIRTDEKMPAKGEISEQESNGDIENSWSQPLGGEQPYRFFNHIENYVARESWSDEGFVCPQTAIEEIKPKPSLACQSSSESLTEAQRTPFTKKPRKPRKPNCTTTTTTIKKNKIFTCDHCPCTFAKLKDRNLHLIVQHDYKRVNRRLIREPPPATITSEQQQHEQQQNHQEVLQENQLPSLLLQQDQLRSTAVAPLIPEIAGEDVKPDTKLQVLTTLDSAQFPRTKFDSIRVSVYRMLMNFNFSTLKQKQNVEFDESLFDSETFSCFNCKRNFLSIKQYDEHLTEHPAECFTCGRKFTRWSYFSIHLKRHLGWKDFECTHCGKKFVTRSVLIEHMRMHTGISPLKCIHCGKNFKRYSNLAQHKWLCHNTRSRKKKEYVCYCGEVLPSKARFIWHREIHDTKPKCCPYCRDRFIHSNSLRRHIRLVHSEKFIYDQPAECPICNQIYAKNSLKGHMSTHTMEIKHECAICNKSFSTKWNLKIHGWVHANRTAKPFKCDMCIKAFVREIDYKNHINAHKQIKPFTCEYCGCKFIRKYNYLRHRREHHGQKKFECELCGKQFHRHYYLIEHRRTHTGERPFLCTICGKSSTTKTNHNKHLKIHHSRDPFTSET